MSRDSPQRRFRLVSAAIRSRASLRRATSAEPSDQPPVWPTDSPDILAAPASRPQRRFVDPLVLGLSSGLTGLCRHQAEAAGTAEGLSPVISSSRGPRCEPFRPGKTADRGPNEPRADGDACPSRKRQRSWDLRRKDRGQSREDLSAEPACRRPVRLDRFSVPLVSDSRVERVVPEPGSPARFGPGSRHSPGVPPRRRLQVRPLRLFRLVFVAHPVLRIRFPCRFASPAPRAVIS